MYGSILISDSEILFWLNRENGGFTSDKSRGPKAPMNLSGVNIFIYIYIIYIYIYLYLYLFIFIFINIFIYEIYLFRIYSFSWRLWDILYSPGDYIYNPAWYVYKQPINTLNRYFHHDYIQKPPPHFKTLYCILDRFTRQINTW